MKAEPDRQGRDCQEQREFLICFVRQYLGGALFTLEELPKKERQKLIPTLVPRTEKISAEWTPVVPENYAYLVEVSNFYTC